MIYDFRRLVLVHRLKHPCLVFLLIIYPLDVLPVFLVDFGLKGSAELVAHVLVLRTQRDAIVAAAEVLQGKAFIGWHAKVLSEQHFRQLIVCAVGARLHGHVVTDGGSDHALEDAAARFRVLRGQ